ncbi:Ephrin [Onchocerca flexuosa]|uniref:Ephrin n=1 Tax=Onchocerca flexuosa TaxID=387005 RepID=A0A238BTQ3_9BILA|nr:Ephrin [Onchocerca flexuosa]
MLVLTENGQKSSTLLTVGFLQEISSNYFRFTDRSLFPQDAEIGAEAAFIEVDAMDSMEIVCPSYSMHDNVDKYEQLVVHQIIWQVSDLSFMSCELDSRSQAFLICDSPLAATSVSHKIVFHQFSSLPNGFEYLPGRSYYLITTSNGSIEGMNNTRLGLCVTANMRLRIDVRPLSDHSYLSSGEGMNTRSELESSKAERTEKWFRDHHVKPSTADSSNTEEDIDRLNNESQKFAEKHGFDLTRLEYVRQLARDGVEGDFLFQELENDSLRSSVDSSEMTLANGPGRPTFSSTLSDHEAFYSTSRQAQRWISKEIQSRVGASRDFFPDQNTSGVEPAKDYVVDDISGAGAILGRLETKYIIVNVLLLLWNSGR